MAHAIDLILSWRGSEAPTRRASQFSRDVLAGDGNRGNSVMTNAINSVIAELGNVAALPSQGLDNSHVDCLVKCSSLLLSVPLSFPRYFYQSLQTTKIKLALSPSQRTPNEPVSVDINEHLALKIEGVICHGGTGSAIMENESSHSSRNMDFASDPSKSRGKSKTFRRISEITITVKSSHAISGRNQNLAAHNFKVAESGNHLERTVKPHNDYFQVQFLLSMPTVGTRNLVIECSLIDEKGARWKCGPTENLAIRCYDDAARIKSAILQSHQGPAR